MKRVIFLAVCIWVGWQATLLAEGPVMKDDNLYNPLLLCETGAMKTHN